MERAGFRGMSHVPTIVSSVAVVARCFILAVAIGSVTQAIVAVANAI